jgi:hypothetical protein
VGDVFRAEGNRQFRIRAMVPLERIEEFVGRPLYGVWEVEPVIEHAVPSASVADAEAGT